MPAPGHLQAQQRVRIKNRGVCSRIVSAGEGYEANPQAVARECFCRKAQTKLQLGLNGRVLDQAFLNGVEIAAIDVEGLHRAPPSNLNAQGVWIGFDLDADRT